jgi:hypothetical protein
MVYTISMRTRYNTTYVTRTVKDRDLHYRVIYEYLPDNIRDGSGCPPTLIRDAECVSITLHDVEIDRRWLVSRGWAAVVDNPPNLEVEYGRV